MYILIYPIHLLLVPDDEILPYALTPLVVLVVCKNNGSSTGVVRGLP